MSVFDHHPWHLRPIGDDEKPGSLLGATDPPLEVTLNELGNSPDRFACKHEGNLVPKSLGKLGLNKAELTRRIARVAGAARLTKALSELKDMRLAALSELKRN